MTNRQALGIDINEWSRTGGINYELVEKHIREGEYDFLIIKAGLGTYQSPLFQEQKREAERRGIPFLTYFLLDPGLDMKEQVRRYVDWVGTEETTYILDVESPRRGHRPPNRSEVLRSVDEIMRLTKKRPVLYSRVQVLDEIGFLDEVRHFDLWIAQYPWDISKLPSRSEQYQYFHDFTRDYADTLPPSALRIDIGENVILWQFSERGRGPYYIYNPTTRDPRFVNGLETADLNISIKGREEFMQQMFGGVPVLRTYAPESAEMDMQPNEATYPGLTNQDMVNLIYSAAKPYTADPWIDWIQRANLESLVVPSGNRRKPYTGPKIENLSYFTAREKAAILTAMKPQVSEVPGKPTYPGITNQDMINVLFTAARPFTEDPWMDWVLRARLGFLAVPSGNRRKPYTGPRVENLPNLNAREKAAILAAM